MHNRTLVFFAKFCLLSGIYTPCKYNVIETKETNSRNLKISKTEQPTNKMRPREESDFSEVTELVRVMSRNWLFWTLNFGCNCFIVGVSQNLKLVWLSCFFAWRHFVDVELDNCLCLFENLIIYLSSAGDEPFLFQMPKAKTNVFSIALVVEL